LDSNSTSIQTCFLNLLLEFTPDNLPDPHPNALFEPYPIALMLIRP
jgi:hypothetical protein